MYLSAVPNLHVSAGLHKEFSKQLTPRLELVLKGIRKEKAKSTPPSCLLITVEIMGSIKAVLARNPTGYDNTLLWAACCQAFFGFLRCGEFTVPSQEAYDSDMHLSLADIALYDKNNPTVIQVTIKQSETDPFRQGVDLYLEKTGKDICPVCAFIPYFVIRGAKPGPLFVFADRRQRFASLVTSTLQRAGIDDKQYNVNTHSFRIGAATTANRHTY